MSKIISKCIWKAYLIKLSLNLSIWFSGHVRSLVSLVWSVSGQNGKLYWSPKFYKHAFSIDCSKPLLNLDWLTQTSIVQTFQPIILNKGIVCTKILFLSLEYFSLPERERKTLFQNKNLKWLLQIISPPPSLATSNWPHIQTHLKFKFSHS